MKVLVTGSNGLLGQKLVALLRQQAGVAVVATSRGANKLAGLYPDLRFVVLDVADGAQVRQVLAQERPTHVIHTAAMTNVDECELNQAACWQQNVTAVAHLVPACANAGIHLTHLSTDFIFSGDAGPLTEEAAPGPVNFYGESKLAAEHLVQASAGRWAIARTVLVYGVAHDYGRTNLVLWVRDSLRRQSHQGSGRPVAHPHPGRGPGPGLLAAGPAGGPGPLPPQQRRAADALCNGPARGRPLRAGQTPH